MEQSARAREEKRQALRAALVPHWTRLRKLLSEREARVLSLRVGLTGAPLSQDRVARRLGLAAGSIAPIEKRARAKVTQALQHQQLGAGPESASASSARVSGAGGV